ncbi:unnamed protein product [Cyprideis torosa]|uniref:Vacuolar protein-sorting-associated protein 36 n=1 Tax=Cyprideis torosa TaxID=163714 RepID=A0A7R8W731_9CRUS|nr:unnamed protein product [Cyprideis torosa]CAG0882865.1 unnamed protein product [Cyprideis torosa]
MTAPHRKCSYCLCKLGEKYIQCVECDGYLSCFECFRLGAESGRHLNSHSYRFEDSGAARVFKDKDGWSGQEEIKLLDAIEYYQFGNWVDTARTVGTRTPEECRSHFLKWYVNGNLGQYVWSPKTNPSLLKSSRLFDHTTTVGGGPLSPSLTTKLEPVEVNPTDAAALGYMPSRDDYEREYDNDAEGLVSGLFVNSSQDEDIDDSLKLCFVDSYVIRLRERIRRKQIARDYQLAKLFFKQSSSGSIAPAALSRKVDTSRVPHAFKTKVTREEKELHERFIKFSQFLTASEHDVLLHNLRKETELQIRIKELMRYRSLGVKTPLGAVRYEALRFKRILAKRQAKRDAKVKERVLKSTVSTRLFGSPSSETQSMATKKAKKVSKKSKRKSQTKSAFFSDNTSPEEGTKDSAAAQLLRNKARKRRKLNFSRKKLCTLKRPHICPQHPASMWIKQGAMIPSEMETSGEETVEDFASLSLDDRLLKAIRLLRWEKPTLIQSTAIPFIMEGKDLLARARTGSGKTGAFAIPVLQKLLLEKRNRTRPAVRAIVLAPTKELCKQLFRDFRALSRCCSSEVNVVDVSEQSNLSAQKPLLLDCPDVVIATPGRLLAHVKAGNINTSEVEILVIDEADLIFSFGYEEDIKGVISSIPSGYQAVLTSATLSADVTALKKMTLQNPVILKLQEPQLPALDQLSQYYMKLEEEDKFLLLAGIFKLRLLRGRTLLFVNSVDRGYKIRLFLEQFGIASCVLNSELPAASRCHTVAQFNAGKYTILIASDDRAVAGETDGKKPSGGGGSNQLQQNPAFVPVLRRSQSSGLALGRKRDVESGVSRGIDFQFVSNVLNVDFPPETDTYIHRVGRTARGNNKGTSLSLVSVKEISVFEEVSLALDDMYAATASSKSDGTSVSVLKPFQFKLNEIESLRYRVRDAYKTVTRIAIREARLKEIKQQIMASQKLKGYFEENPSDLSALRHDRELRTVKVSDGGNGFIRWWEWIYSMVGMDLFDGGNGFIRWWIQEHLRDVPEYLLPPKLKRLRPLIGSLGSGKKSKSGPSSGSGKGRGTKRPKQSRAERRHQNMSVNSGHTSGGVLVHAGEYIILFDKNVHLTFSGAGLQKKEFSGTKKGLIYLTTHRIVFTNQDPGDALQSLSVPFAHLTDVELEQPTFGANFITGKVRAQEGGGWVGEVKFNLTFKSGGAIDFGKAMLQAAIMTKRYANQKPPQDYNAPPSYASVYPAPPPYYAPPNQAGYYGWVPPYTAFPDRPDGSSVYMTDAPPPYPGIGGYTAPPPPGLNGSTNGTATGVAYYDPSNPHKAYVSAPPPGSGMEPPPPYNAAVGSDEAKKKND